jgi:hypothetical protein
VGLVALGFRRHRWLVLWKPKLSSNRAKQNFGRVCPSTLPFRCQHLSIRLCTLICTTYPTPFYYLISRTRSHQRCVAFSSPLSFPSSRLSGEAAARELHLPLELACLERRSQTAPMRRWRLVWCALRPAICRRGPGYSSIHLLVVAWWISSTNPFEHNDTVDLHPICKVSVGTGCANGRQVPVPLWSRTLHASQLAMMGPSRRPVIP